MKSLLESAIRKREPLRTQTNALRLINSSGDGLDGLILEQFHNHFSAQVLNAHWLKEIPKLTEVLQAQFDVEFFIVKDRSKTNSAKPELIGSTIIIGNEGQSATIVEENGLRFAVDLNDGLNVGLFLDMRANRDRIGAGAKDKRVLNCFAYTCSFGVYARRGGAREVVNVDISKKILDCGRHNYELNKILTERNEFIRAEVGEYLAKAVKVENRFDIIVLDPPSFAKTAHGAFQVKKDMPRLMAQARAILNPGGMVLASTNFNGMSYEDIKAMLPTGFKKVVRVGQDMDFTGSNTFKESYLVGCQAVLA